MCIDLLLWITTMPSNRKPVGVVGELLTVKCVAMNRRKGQSYINRPL